MECPRCSKQVLYEIDPPHTLRLWEVAESVKGARVLGGTHDDQIDGWAHLLKVVPHQCTPVQADDTPKDTPENIERYWTGVRNYAYDRDCPTCSTRLNSPCRDMRQKSRVFLERDIIRWPHRARYAELLAEDPWFAEMEPIALEHRE